MRPTPLFVSLSLTALVLSGCGLAPTGKAEPALSETAFERRMSRLEASLVSRCDLQETRLARLDDRLGHLGERQGALASGMEQIDSQLRQVHGSLGQMRQRSEEPVVVTTECDAAGVDPLGGKTLVGRTEWIGMPDLGTYLTASIDTGSGSSALAASDITPFERDGEDWVRFSLGLAEEDEATDTARNEPVEAPIQRRVRVVQADLEEFRPVVSLVVSLGSIQESVDFTLRSRSQLDQPVLLGRNFLMDLAVVDVAETHLFPRPEFAADDSPDAEDGERNGDNR